MNFLGNYFKRRLPASLTLRRLIPSAVVLIVGTALSLIAFAELWKEEAANRQLIFERIAEARVGAIEKNVSSAMGELRAFSGLFAASEEVSRDEFAKFFSHLILPAGSVQAFEWIPRVAHDQRIAFERAAHAEGFPNFQFTERRTPGKMGRAERRAEYFPVYYVAPLKGNEAAFGFDLGSEPTRLAALTKARDTGQMVASARITLVQETGKQFGFLVFLPLYHGGDIPEGLAERANKLTGFVLGVFRILSIVRQPQQKLIDGDPNLQVYVFDVSAPPGERLLFPRGATAGNKSDLDFAISIIRTISVGDRIWEIVVAPGEGSVQPLWEPWAALVGGLLFTILLSIYLFLSSLKNVRLAESEGLFRSFLENSPSAILLKKTDGTYLFANRLWHEWFNPDFAEIGKTNLSDFFPDDHAEAVRELEKLVREKGIPVSAEIMTPLANGRTIPTILQKFPVYGAYNQLVGIGGINTDISDRKQAELEVSLVRDDLARLIDTANAPIFGVDTEGNLNEWNQMVASITGYTKEEVIGRDLVELLVADELKEIGYRIIAEGLTGKSLTNFEMQFLTKDGRIVEILLNSTARKDNEGNIVGVVGVGQDITERKYSEAELTRARDDLTRLIDTANAPIFGVDFDGNVNEWNRAVARISGYDKAEVMGRNLVEFLIPDQYKTEVQEVIAKGLSGEETANYESPILTKDGRTVEILLNSTSRKDNAGNIVGVVGIGQDITERNRTELERRRLAAIVENSSDFIGLCNPDGSVFYVNRAGRQLLGLSAGPAAELYQMDNYLPENVLSDFQSKVFPTIMEGGEWRGTLALRHFLTGEPVPVEMTAFGILDPVSGELTACATVSRDIRGKLREEEQQVKLRSTIELSDKMASLGQLAAGVAHEINNPIGFINSNLKTAQEYVEGMQELIVLQNELERELEKDGGEVKKMLGRIKKLKKEIDLDFIMDDHPRLLADSVEGAERVIGIVRNMRIFSHADPGVKEEADINQGIESTLKLVWNELKYKATIKKDLGPISKVEGHPQQLNQVFLNLFVNAAQAIEDRGEIAISTSMENNHVVIRVEDTGRGIPPDSIERIFEPFYTTKDIGEGTGLGLSVSYNIIQKHHGTMEVDSEVGRGTVFTIKLPVKSHRGKVQG